MSMLDFFRRARADASAPAPLGASPSGLTRDHVVWAYRILLDRDPESEEVIVPKLRAYRTTRELRADIVTSAEFQDKNRDFAHSNERNLVIKELAPGLRLFVDLADHAIGLNIVRGRYERSEIDFIRRVVRPGSHVVDCGAHVGFFTMHLADAVGPMGSVNAFEPFASNADCLALSIEENRFAGCVTLERAAVGDRTREATLVYARETLNSGGAFIVGSERDVPSGHASTTVRIVALDEYALPRPISFMKLDVEGAEPLALRGADRLLREDRPVLLCELHAEQLARVSRTTPAAFIEEMQARGYDARRLEDGAPGELVTGRIGEPVISVAFVPR